MTTAQILSVSVVSLIFLVFILELIRRHKLAEEYALLWIIVAVIFFSVPWLYDLHSTLARFMGIIDPTSYFFFWAIMLLMLLALQACLSLTRSRSHRIALAQNIALLERRVRQLEEYLREELSEGIDSI